MSSHGSVEEALGGPRSLPEMLFGTRLTLTHERSGITLHFNAVDALREWQVRTLRCHARLEYRVWLSRSRLSTH